MYSISDNLIYFTKKGQLSTWNCGQNRKTNSPYFTLWYLEHNRSQKKLNGKISWWRKYMYTISDNLIYFTKNGQLSTSICGQNRKTFYPFFILWYLEHSSSQETSNGKISWWQKFFVSSYRKMVICTPSVKIWYISPKMVNFQCGFVDKIAKPPIHLLHYDTWNIVGARKN